MLHPPRPAVEQREQQQTQPRPAVVAAEVGARAAQSGIQAAPADIAVEQLEPAVRRPLLRHELDRQISLDHLPRARRVAGEVSSTRAARTSARSLLEWAS